MIEENLLSQFAINCILTNITTEKYYYITLNKENNYTAEVSLNPRTYEIDSNVDMAQNTGITVKASAKNITLSKKEKKKISFTIKNPKKLSEIVNSVQPLPDILSADKFSQQIQLDGKVISIKDIVPYLNLIYEDGGKVGNDCTIEAYEKINLKDKKRGITITLQNKTDNELSYNKCDIIAIKLSKNRAVFPGGVTIGMSPSSVCHKSDGIYGKPDKFNGSLLYGWGYANTKAIYLNSNSGDRLTIEMGPDGSYVNSIKYEIGLFE